MSGQWNVHCVGAGAASIMSVASIARETIFSLHTNSIPHLMLKCLTDNLNDWTLANASDMTLNLNLSLSSSITPMLMTLCCQWHQRHIVNQALTLNPCTVLCVRWFALTHLYCIGQQPTCSNLHVHYGSNLHVHYGSNLHVHYGSNLHVRMVNTYKELNNIEVHAVASSISPPHNVDISQSLSCCHVAVDSRTRKVDPWKAVTLALNLAAATTHEATPILTCQYSTVKLCNSVVNNFRWHKKVTLSL